MIKNICTDCAHAAVCSHKVNADLITKEFMAINKEDERIGSPFRASFFCIYFKREEAATQDCGELHMDIYDKFEARESVIFNELIRPFGEYIDNLEEVKKQKTKYCFLCGCTDYHIIESGDLICKKCGNSYLYSHLR